MVEPVSCTAIGLCCFCCAPWCSKRCCRAGTNDSKGWPEAPPEEVREILYTAQLTMGAYSLTKEDAVRDGAHTVELDAVERLVPHDSDGKCPAHIIYLDKIKKAVVLCIRGLQMGSPTDWRILGGNKKGQHPYKGGYVHHEFIAAGQWLLDNEGPFIKELLEANPGYRLLVAGHSLGAGVALLFTVLVVDGPGVLGDLPRERVKCYAFAPPRIMSLRLAVKYADVLNSVVVQDDYLPRISTSTVKKVFPLASKTGCFCRYGITCAFSALCVRFCQDTFIGEKRMLKDEQRLYPPGRLYHIVFKDSKPCKKTHVHTKVVTSIPVKGRFERAVLTKTTFFDHNLTAAIKVLTHDLHVEDIREASTRAPAVQHIERQASRVAEHGEAIKEWEQIRAMLALAGKRKHVRAILQPSMDGVKDGEEVVGEEHLGTLTLVVAPLEQEQQSAGIIAGTALEVASTVAAEDSSKGIDLASQVVELREAPAASLVQQPELAKWTENESADARLKLPSAESRTSESRTSQARQADGELLSSTSDVPSASLIIEDTVEDVPSKPSQGGVSTGSVNTHEVVGPGTSASDADVTISPKTSGADVKSTVPSSDAACNRSSTQSPRVP